MLYAPAIEHKRLELPRRRECRYCKWLYKEGKWAPKLRRLQIPLGDITNMDLRMRMAGKKQRVSQTTQTCIQCTVYLCKLGDCWDRWHAKMG